MTTSACPLVFNFAARELMRAIGSVKVRPSVVPGLSLYGTSCAIAPMNATFMPEGDVHTL